MELGSMVPGMVGKAARHSPCSILKITLVAISITPYGKRGCMASPWVVVTRPQSSESGGPHCRTPADDTGYRCSRGHGSDCSAAAKRYRGDGSLGLAQ